MLLLPNRMSFLKVSNINQCAFWKGFQWANLSAGRFFRRGYITLVRKTFHREKVTKSKKKNPRNFFPTNFPKWGNLSPLSLSFSHSISLCLCHCKSSISDTCGIDKNWPSVKKVHVGPFWEYHLPYTCIFTLPLFNTKSL